MPLPAAAAVLLAGLLDHQFAEPPAWIHPVVWLGRPIATVDRRFRDSRAAGVLAALLIPIGFGAVAACLVGGTTLAVDHLLAESAVAGPAVAESAVTESVVAGPAVAGLAVGEPAATGDPGTTPGTIAGAVVAGAVLFACASLRMLTDVASDVAGLAGRDLERAREDLLALAGRDATTLSAGEVRSAAVESAAENLADGLVAPLGAFATVAALAGVLGATALALPLAAGAAAWVKGVNTLDSMLGYREKRVGWAPARLDDVVMWLPARAAAVVLALAVGSPGALVRARPWARIPPSPNSGWPMATAAAALDVRLEKPGAYVLNPDRDLPTDREAARGVRIVSRAGWLVILSAGVLAAV